MSKHINQWLNAYYDGELSGQRLKQVEAHLADCSACQEELAQLGSLTDLLLAVPPASEITPPGRFAAQVALQLPRSPAQPVWRRALRIGWQLAPVGLLAVLAIMQAGSIVTAALLFLQRFGIGEELLASLQARPAALANMRVSSELFGIDLGSLGRVAAGIPDLGGLLGPGLILKFVVPGLIGLLYLLWVSSWWMTQQR